MARNNVTKGVILGYWKPDGRGWVGQRQVDGGWASEIRRKEKQGGGPGSKRKLPNDEKT